VNAGEAEVARRGPVVRELGSPPSESWDAYVRAHSDATVYHLAAWAEILRRAYGFKPRYLAVEGGDGGLAGVLPLVYRGGPISGPRLNSLPVVRWAGPLSRSPEADAAMLEAACERVRSGEARRFHFRSRRDGYERLLPELSVEHELPAWEIDLPPSLDDFRARFGKPSRGLLRNVTTAARSGVTVREGNTSRDLQRFYRLYLEAMRRHAEPPRRLRQLKIAQRLLAPSSTFRLFVAEHQDRTVAGGVFHFFRDCVDLLYNASDERHLDVRPNHALYWEVIRLAIEEGCRRFDFGAARPGSSLAEFKRRWSAEPVPRYRYTFPAGTHPRERSAAPSGSRRSVARLAWSRSPLLVTRIGGAVTYRYL
jgi:predicted N-acyltransferase